MIATNPDFIKGDQLTIKQYLASILTNKRLVYSSLWNWWKKTTLFWSIPLLVGSLTIWMALLLQDWKAGEFHWLLMASLSILPFILFPFIWAVAYYYSYVEPRNIEGKLTGLLNTFIPGASQIRGISRTNYIFLWKELEYELAYTFIPAVNSRGKVTKMYKCFIVCLHFVPDPKHRSEITDENGKLLDSFLDQCYAYCEGKDSCRTLRFEDNSMYAFYREQDLCDDHLIMNTMDQMQYIADRFHLQPLYLTKSLGSEIKFWLQVNDQPAPEEIVALNIGIFETEAGYSLHLTGSKVYDPNDEDWACNDDYVAVEKYLEMPMSKHTPDDWKNFQELVKANVEKYVLAKKEDEHSLFYHRIVTIGFDDGNLEIISNG